MNKVEDFSDIIIKNKDNKFIVDEFIKYYMFIYTTYTESPKTSRENYYKLLIIKKIINIIANYKTKIINGDELKSIKGIGAKTIARINEILKTGKLSEIIEQKKQVKSITELASIYGIGPSKASYFYKKYGIETIDELLKNIDIVLTNQMKLGIKYKNKLNENIPKILIARLENYIQEQLYNIDNNLMSVICGSYRRGKDHSSDIDILITHKQLKLKSETGIIMKKIINNLEKNFIIDKLTQSYNTHFNGFASFKNIPKLPTEYDHSVFNVNNDVVRCDIIVVPIDSFYTALLHFTGSGQFNQNLRKQAKLLDMKLNEYGLFKNDSKKSLVINSEVDIFKFLLLKYVPPRAR